MKERYGSNFCKKSTELKYHEKLIIEEVEIFLAPAGHVLGSAQVVMNFANQVITVSGDYKRQDDPTCAAFEPIKSDIFITEATFPLPVIKHPNAKTKIKLLIK